MREVIDRENCIQPSIRLTLGDDQGGSDPSASPDLP